MRSLSADGLDLLAEDVRDASSWRRRIERDRERAGGMQPQEIREPTTTLVTRCVRAGALAVALTGSTVRGRRTVASDLDVHVVGARPSLVEVEVDVDVYATSADVLFERLRAGDDYVQWTLRFGWVLFDTGVLRAAAAELVASSRWPSPERKLGQARRILHVAEQVLASGDVEASAEQVKSALTAVARWRLLAAGTFPLSRAELSAQLRSVGDGELAAALNQCVRGDVRADDLHTFVALASRAIAAAGDPATRLTQVR